MNKGRLLTDKELARAFNSYSDKLIPSNWDLHCSDDLRDVAKAQRDLTASIIRAEWETRIVRAIDEVNERRSAEHKLENTVKDAEYDKQYVKHVECSAQITSEMLEAKDAECQEEVGRIKMEIESKAMYFQGNISGTGDLYITREDWRGFWKKEEK